MLWYERQENDKEIAKLNNKTKTIKPWGALADLYLLGINGAVILWLFLK